MIARDTEEKANLLLSLGINLNFAPVCDVTVSPKDFMYTRAFGLDAAQTSEYVRTVVSAARGRGMGSVLKHFPGYGDNPDTHYGAVVDSRDYAVFEETEFLPFTAGIEAGAGVILVSHNIVACMDQEYPASLSPEVHRILRDELGFEGVIITDDLAMDAIRVFASDGDAAVLAALAGNDMICCSNFTEQVPSVIAAVHNGVLQEDALDRAVIRILCLKLDLGIID